MSPKTREPNERREAILDAAFDLLSKYGVDGMRLEEVAKLARVSKGSLYQIAQNKGDLVFLVFQRITEQEIIRFENAVGNSDDPRIWLRNSILSLLPTMREAPGNYAMRFDFFALALRDEKLGQRFNDYIDGVIQEATKVLDRKIDDGIAKGFLYPALDKEILADIMHGWVHHLWTEWVMRPQLELEYLQNITERFIKFIIDAVVIKR